MKRSMGLGTVEVCLSLANGVLHVLREAGAEREVSEQTHILLSMTLPHSTEPRGANPSL